MTSATAAVLRDQSVKQLGVSVLGIKTWKTYHFISHGQLCHAAILNCVFAASASAMVFHQCVETASGTKAFFTAIYIAMTSCAIQFCLLIYVQKTSQQGVTGRLHAGFACWLNYPKMGRRCTRPCYEGRNVEIPKIP